MTLIAFSTGQPLVLSELAPACSPSPVPRSQKNTPATRKRGTEKDEARKAMLAKVHVAKKQLMDQYGMTDADYRDMLINLFDVESSKYLDHAQLHRLLLELAKVGFKPKKGHAKAGSNRKKTVPATLTEDSSGLNRVPLMSKIEALLAEKGRVESTDVPWGYAVSILKNQTGGVVRHFDHATPEQLRKVIAALTYDAKRKGRITHAHGV